jgi:hypothetical protein
LDASDCAICSRERLCSEVDANEGSGVGVALGDRAAFSVATIDKGRLRERSDDDEFGRRCQLRVELLGGIALDGDALIEQSRFGAKSATSRSPLIGGGSSFVGGVEKPDPSITSSICVSRCGSMPA